MLLRLLGDASRELPSLFYPEMKLKQLYSQDRDLYP